MADQFIDNEDGLFLPFKKTNDLVQGTRYKVNYLRRVHTQFGVRIRAKMNDFTYDLPPKFVIQLASYDLDMIDYRPVYLQYEGRRVDSYHTIIMRLYGMPANPDAPPVVGAIVPLNESTDSARTKTTIVKIHPFFNQFPRPKPLPPTELEQRSFVKKITTRARSLLVSKAPAVQKIAVSTANKSTSTLSLPDNIPFEKLCKICYVNEKNTVVLPCSHFSFCVSCQMTLGRCALCRRRIKSYISVYDC